MLALKIRKIGKSKGVLLPAKLLARLGVGVGDTIFVTESPDGYRISANTPEIEAQMAEARRVMQEDRETLRDLSE